MAEFTISKHPCACGCDTLMPQNLVDLGWKFLRGHKPKAEKASLRIGEREETNGRVRSSQQAMAETVAFLHARLADLDQQYASVSKTIDDGVMRRIAITEDQERCKAALKPLETLISKEVPCKTA